MVTLEQRIKQYRITSRAAINTAFEPRDAWDKSARHYVVKLTMADTGWGKRTLTTEYHMGSAHTKPPTTLEVMASLLSEARDVVDGDGFTWWAENFGMDTDSRKAEELYREVVRQTEALRNFLLTDRDPWPLWLENTEIDL